jgi:general stress protein 26
LTDPDIKKELWYDGWEYHFSGTEDPNYCVLKFTSKRYNLFLDYT